jgi:ribosomal protein L23
MVNVVKNKVGLFNVVQFPCMTTKAKYLNEKRNQIVIFVSLDATKIDIINAVELAFGIEVAKVNVMIKKGKNKVAGRRYPYTEKKTKKAIVFFKNKELASKIVSDTQQGMLAHVGNENKE